MFVAFVLTKNLVKSLPSLLQVKIHRPEFVLTEPRSLDKAGVFGEVARRVLNNTFGFDLC